MLASLLRSVYLALHCKIDPRQKMISMVIFDTDHSFKRQNVLCLTKKSFSKDSMVHRSCLVIIYFEETFCVLARVGETCVTITANNLVKKIISSVIFHTNHSFKQ